MNLLRWVAPAVMAVAGWVAGSWLSTHVDALEDLGLVLSSKKSMQRASSVVSGAPTISHDVKESSVDEAELKRLWKRSDLETTLAAFVAYARTHPGRALDLAMSLEGPDAWELVMKLVLGLPPEQGALAMDVLKRHPQYCRPCPPFDAVFVLCAKSDPERAWIEAHAPGAKFTAAALDAIARGCGEVNPAVAMTLAERLTAPDEKAEFARTVLREWSSSDARGLIAWLGGQQDREKLAALVPWGRIRLESWEDFLDMTKVVPLELIDGSQGGRFSFGDAGENGWATRTDWLQALPEGETRQAFFAGAARALVGSDPEKALALLPQIVDARLKQRVLSATAAYRAAVSPEEGFAFASSLNDASARTLARASVMRTWAENDPVAAARHALSSHEYDDLMAHLGFRWAEIDPQSAVSTALAEEHPESGIAMGSTMLGTAMSRWVSADPFEASRWVSELRAGPQHDRAVAALALGAVYSEPEGAMNWAASIIDEALRKQTLTSGFNRWLSNDRSQAVTWLDGVTLDDSTRKTLEEQVQSTAQELPAGNRSRSFEGFMVVY